MIAVLITGVGMGSTGEQILKALRAGRREYRLVVGNTEARRLIVADDEQRVRLPSAEDPAYVAAVAAAANECGARFIAPGSDRELRRLAAARAELARHTDAVLLANNSATIELCMDKHAAAAAIARSGCRVPTTVDCASGDMAARTAEMAGMSYPVVVKPRHGGGGSVNVFIAQDDGELRFFADYVIRNSDAAILQEYVGDEDSEYSVGVLHYPDGTHAGSVSVRRQFSTLLSTRLRVPNRTGREELGPSLVISTGFSQGEVGQFPPAQAPAERVARELGSTGPLNIQGRMIGSELVVFEINPRFSGSTGVRALIGWNSPEALIDWHLGTPRRLDGGRRATFVRGLTDHVAFD